MNVGRNRSGKLIFKIGEEKKMYSLHSVNTLESVFRSVTFWYESVSTDLHLSRPLAPPMSRLVSDIPISLLYSYYAFSPVDYVFSPVGIISGDTIPMNYGSGSESYSFVDDKKGN